MRVDKKIRDEKLQLNINRQAAKISVLSSGKTDKYEYLAGKEILPTDQSKVKEETKFSCWPLGKAFEKQTKKTWRLREKTNRSFRSFHVCWTTTTKTKINWRHKRSAKWWN